MPHIVPLEEFRSAAGRQLAPSSWMEITQERVRKFAEATDDYQFIHLDPVRASATPFGGTIAHGYLTLSLLVKLNEETALLPEGRKMTINYGADKVRFVSPVRVGSRIRSHQRVLQVSERTPGYWLIRTAVTVEIENQAKPAMQAEVMYLHVVK